MWRTDSAALEAAQVAYNQQIGEIVDRQAALGRHVSFVDMHAACGPEDIHDGVHPSLAGYDKMADAWFPAITAVISPLGHDSPPEVAGVDPSLGLQQVAVAFSKPVEDAAAGGIRECSEGRVELWLDTLNHMVQYGGIGSGQARAASPLSLCWLGHQARCALLAHCEHHACSMASPPPRLAKAIVSRDKSALADVWTVRVTRKIGGGLVTRSK